MEHLGGDTALTALFPWAQLLTIAAKLGKLDPTQCCLNCEVKVFKKKNQCQIYDFLNSWQMLAARFYVPGFSCVLLYCIPKSDAK